MLQPQNEPPQLPHGTSQLSGWQEMQVMDQPHRIKKNRFFEDILSYEDYRNCHCTQRCY